MQLEEYFDFLAENDIRIKGTRKVFQKPIKTALPTYQ